MNYIELLNRVLLLEYLKYIAYSIIGYLESWIEYSALKYVVFRLYIRALQVKDEAPKLLKALEALKHPKEFAFHVGKDLIVNHADIFQEVSTAIDDFHAQKWEECGKSTGAALSKLLVGEMSLASSASYR